MTKKKTEDEDVAAFLLQYNEAIDESQEMSQNLYRKISVKCNKKQLMNDCDKLIVTQNLRIIISHTMLLNIKTHRKHHVVIKTQPRVQRKRQFYLMVDLRLQAHNKNKEANENKMNLKKINKNL